MTNKPHDSWAKYYDFAYGKTFGTYYQHFTDTTLAYIRSAMPEGKVLDLGAGTGRLAIPLAKQGYQVIAVEKSNAMVDVFRSKCTEENLDIPIHSSSIADYDNGSADLALALFTVLSYITSEEEMKKSIENIAKHLNTGGYFFFDLPNPVFFSMVHIINKNELGFKRTVSVEPSDHKEMYHYREACSGIMDGENFDYVDDFLIRHWTLSQLDDLLQSFGLKDTGKSFPAFASSGSNYKLYQKV